jgi:hypothetical protein
MKTKQIFIPLITIFIFFLTACKKDTINDPAPTLTATLSADSNYLSKYTYIETNGIIYDSTVTSFTYDNLKRVTKIITYPYNSYETKFLYNGTDILPHMKVIDTSGILKSKNFYTYSNSGLLLKDSSIEKTFDLSGQLNILATTIKNYNYSANKIYEYIRYERLNIVSNTSQITSDFDTTNLDANNNPIAIYKTQRAINCTYGINPSPMLNVNVNSVYSLERDENILFQIYGSKNIITSWRHTNFYNGVGTVSFNKNYTNFYTFKANGFPSLILTNPQNGYYFKLKFMYTSL